MKEDLLNLIRERTNKVLLAVEMLKKKFGDIKFAAANKGSGQVPKKGFLDRAETTSYNLHGSGADVIFGSEKIEFDFNFNTDNHTGFNSWRLNAFLSRQRMEFNELADLSIENIQSLLIELERENQIRFDAAENLYYLPDDLNSADKSKARKIELALS
jgi:hypothetical protein